MRGKRRAALSLLALLFLALLALGWWQLERRAWKLALIDRVEQRVHAPAVELPRIFGDDEYLRVRVNGRFLYAAQVFVQAVTEKGAGFWVLTPLQRADGSTLMVNRGFVAPESRDAVRSGTSDEVQLTGLLRLSEPGGGFLRRNEPAAGRWYSRDVAAIAQARGLARVVADRFVDADACGQAPPIGGLTVIAFHNSHLVYAVTWFALALMVAGAFCYLRQHTPDDDDTDAAH